MLQSVSEGTSQKWCQMNLSKAPKPLA